MPKNFHRAVKMFRNYSITRLNGFVWTCLVIYTAFAGFLALITGGILSGALLLLAHPLALGILLKQQRFARSSALLGVGVIVLVGLFEIADLKPPEIEAISPLGLWLALALTIFLGLTFFYQSDVEAPVIRRSDLEQSAGLATAGRRIVDLLRDSNAAAFVTISSLGRIDQVFGAHDLTKHYRSGDQAAHVLVDGDGQMLGTGLATLPSGETVYALQHKDHERGNAMILLMRAGGRAEAQGQDDAQDALQQRTQFFAEFGHDLRSPLNAVIGFADVMANEVRGPIPEAYVEYPGLIKESGETLLSLVEDMLAYARSEVGTYQLKLEPTHLGLIAEEVIRSLADTAARQQVTLNLEEGEEVWAEADQMAIRRILDNLISNALKYSSPGSVVTISAEKTNATVRLSVADTGAGMEAEDLARITEPFAQGQNAKGKAGLGLGLALVRRLSELQDGEMQIDSTLGEGTIVTITLPAAAARGVNEAAE